MNDELLTFPAPSAELVALWRRGQRVRAMNEYRAEAVIEPDAIPYEISISIMRRAPSPGAGFLYWAGIRPRLADCKAALTFGLPVAITQDRIERAYHEHDRRSRFNRACYDRGYEFDCRKSRAEQVHANGSRTYYAPDAEGYPVAMYSVDQDGNILGGE